MNPSLYLSFCFIPTVGFIPPIIPFHSPWLLSPFPCQITRQCKYLNRGLQWIWNITPSIVATLGIYFFIHIYQDCYLSIALQLEYNLEDTINHRVEYSETLSLVLYLKLISVLSLAFHFDWQLHQLDLSNV